MRPRTLLLDRLITLVVAVLLVAAGVAAWLWYFAVLLTAPRIDVGPVQDVLATGWWPWAAGAAGVVLVLLGLRRIGAHVPQTGVGSLRLGRSSDAGSLAVDAKALSTAAADEVADVEGVRSARGRMRSTRGQLVTELVVVVEPAASLALVAQSCDRVAAAVAAMAQRGDLTFLVDLRVARHGRAISRAG